MISLQRLFRVKRPEVTMRAMFTMINYDLGANIHMNVKGGMIYLVVVKRLVE